MSNIKFFRGSIFVTLIGLIAAFYVGFETPASGKYAGDSALEIGLKFMFIAAILSVLEVSLSFDNAVVNATVLKDMDPIWRKRFITWGMLIAVFGMRIVFPIIIVSVIAKIDPVSAFKLAVNDPKGYESVLTSAHIAVSGFGGAFLMMVFLKFFLDKEKDVHWIKVIESPLSKIGKMEAFEIVVCLGIMYAVSLFIPGEAGVDPVKNQMSFMLAGIGGIVSYVVVDGLSSLLESEESGGNTATTTAAAKSGFASFMYLEVLDASFSFDGVIGAFALSNNIFIIAIGLGIGAMFVRSLTIMFVEKETLEAFRYLEHGAFYAIGALATIMFLGTIQHIPEVLTGLIGAAFIGLALFSSVRYNKHHSSQ